MGKIVQFFSDVKAEMMKVVWPSRMEVIKNTAVVVVLCLVVAAILGAADFGLLKGFEEILSRQQ